MARKLPFDPKTLGPLTFGFDIGIASVGWAVLNDVRIVDLGVRCFDAAENPKTGESLGTKWRTDKIARRRLGRRADRLKALLRLFAREGLLAKPDHALLSAPPTEKHGVNPRTPWALRSRGLDELLSPDDWARVLYHLVKRRGFMSTRKAERVQKETTSASAKEKMGLLAGVAATAKLLVDGETRKYRTLGEMAYKAEPFAQAKRNKAGEYKRSFDRALLLDEMRQLFARQRALKSAHATEEFQAEVEALFIHQKPAVTGEAMLKLMARCNLEPTEFRAPKYSYSAERFIWLGKLANLRIVANGERRELSSTERSFALPLPYNNKTGKITYKQLRAAIGLPQSAAVGFAGLSYGTKRNKKGEDVDPEETTLVQLRAWPDLREAFLDAKLEESWQKLSIHPDQMDAAAYALSVFQTDDEIRPALAKLDFSDAEIEALLTLDFKGFLMVSVKAIRKLLPHMELGFRYDEACEKAGYSHYKPQGESKALNLLPKFRYEDVRNPVVFRALNQARNVLNALIRLYGLPAAIHVELARDLSKSFDERREITRDQEVYRKQREDAEKLFAEHFSGHAPNPRNQDLLKYRLYKEQDGKCAYSLMPLDLERIIELGYCEVDHALPYSRSFDDSMNNKVLALTKANRDKGNKTPFEYLGGANESQAWREFEAYVVGNKKLRKAKKDRLLRQNFDDASAEGFKERNLNDTRWVVKLFANRIKDNLRFAPDATGVVSKNPVLTPSGGYTSFLRTRWGLHKNREASDLHHAQDACVIAAASASLIKRVSDYNRKRETLEILPGGAIVDTNTGQVLKDAKAFFPEPWRHFRDEVLARLSYDPVKAIPLSGIAYDADAIASLKPVLVSRAVKRRAGGAVHQDTVRSIKSHLGPLTSSKRTRLTDLTLAKLDQVVGAQDPRNAGLMYVLRTRLEEFGGDGKKAFAVNQPPVYKPRRDFTDGPVINAVHVKDVQKGGVPVRGGVADQASMWRVDVFRKEGKHYLVPIYQAHRRKGAELPNRAVTPSKPREQWDEMKDEDFVHSLYPNDLLHLRQTTAKQFFGYFGGLDIATNSITVISHDRNENAGKDGAWRSLGVKTAIAIEKMNIDVLGNVFYVKGETRHGLA
jgi:CRISPR-associated endonuclease Csn1